MPLPAWWLAASEQAHAAGAQTPPLWSLPAAAAPPADAAESSSPAAGPGGLWANLSSAVDLAQLRPQQAEGVVVRELRDRSGVYYVLKNPRASTYLRLTPREYWLWQRLDGRQSIQDLVVEYFLEHGGFAFGLITGLVQQLFQKRLLRQQPGHVFSAVTQALNERTLGYKLATPARALLTRQWAIDGLDGLLARLYRGGAWVFFTWPAQILYFLISVVGLYLLVRILGDARFTLGNGDLGASVVALWVAAIAPVVVHELGHALTVKHYAREVPRGGLMLYFGMPAAFVDTTDIWLEDKRARLAVTWAGPYTGFIIAGLCALLVWINPDWPAAPLLLQTAVLAALTSLLNLNPLLKLDGYYLLSDALEIPRLRERSLAFVQHKLAAKLLARERFSRDEVIFVIFGLLSAVWTVYIIYVSLVVWNARIADSMQSLLASNGDLGALAINIGLIVLAISFLGLTGAQLVRLGRAGLARARRAGMFAGPGRVAAALLALALVITVTLMFLPAWTVPSVAAFITALALASALSACLSVAGGLAGTRRPAAAWYLLAAACSAWALARAYSGGALPPVLARSLDLIGLVLCALSLAAGGPFFAGLTGSWRVWSIGLVVLGAALIWSNLGAVALPPLSWLAALLVAAGVAHWRAFRAPPITPAQSLSRPLTARDRLWDTFELLAEACGSQLAAAYGQGLTNRWQARFNRTSVWRGWGLRFASRQLAPPPPSFAELPVDDVADILAGALTVLLDEAAKLVGRAHTQRLLSRAYDALSWDQRETAEDYLLPPVSWAAGLTERFSVTQHDVLTLLRRSPLFVAFTPEELQALAGRLRPEHFAQGQDILRQGDPGERFYIMRRGRVAVLHQDADGLTATLSELVAGDYFGEAALLTDAPRNATVRALSPVEVLSLGRRDFDQLLRAGFNGREKVNAALRRVGLLRRIPLFKEFESYELQLIAARLETVDVEAGQEVVAQGAPGDTFYIVEAGELAVQLRLPSGEVVEQARRGPGEYFGEIALLLNVPRTASVVARLPTRLLVLRAEPFAELVSESLSFRRALERVGSGRMLQNAQTVSRSLPAGAPAGGEAG